MKRPHKYRAKAVICPETGDHFDSKSEYKRWCELKLLERAGQIRNLRRQVAFPLFYGHTPVKIRSPRYPNGRQVKLVLDFEYVEGDEVIVEDRKGMFTAEAKLKYAFFEAQYGKQIRITR